MYCTATQMRRAVPQRPEPSVTILVIEDERFVREITCEILRAAGYRVLHAECSMAARRVFQHYGNRIQLLLCDAVLPDSSEILLSQTLRRPSDGLKIIFVSGYPEGAVPENREGNPNASFWPSLTAKPL